jgi:HSP20 family protein
MLTRWDPFRDMVSMRRMMDRLIDQSLTGEGENVQAEWTLPLDVIEQENEFVVKASLPGVKLDDIDVTFNKGMLTIKGEMKEESEKEEGQYHLHERRWGSYSRSIALPSSVEANAIRAEYQDGILLLRLPKTEEVKPKRITINAGQKAIEGNGGKSR